MKRPSFSEINAAVQELIPNPEKCEAGFFNLYKVFQHAIAAYMLENKRGIVKYKLHWPIMLQRAYYALRSFKGYAAPTSLKSIVFRDDARRGSDKDGEVRSFYIHRLKESLDPDSYSTIAQPFSPNSDKFDVSISQIDSLQNAPLKKAERLLLHELQLLAARASSWLPAEIMPYLYAALQVFFESYHRYYQFFRSQTLSHLIMTTHYHNEGLIAAAKACGIRVIELQHGLISPLDVYFNYPESLRPFSERALFADDIVVFGNYWKDVLLQGSEYPEERIHVAGDYSLTSLKNGESVSSTFSKQNVLLVCAQKNLSGDYLSYLDFLLEKVAPEHPEWEFWVKLHPLEKEVDRYMAYQDKKQCRVIGKEGDLNELLEVAKIQVTIYSTTLYDALGKGVVNFALQDYGKFADYAASMVDTGVALGLRADEDPISRFESLGDHALSLKREDVYAKYNPAVFTSLLS